MTKNTIILACLCASFTAAQAQQNHLKLHFGYEFANRVILQLPQIGDTGQGYQRDYETRPLIAIGFAHEKASGNFWEITGRTNAFIGSQSVYDYPIDSILTGPLFELGKERNNHAQLQFEYNSLQCTSIDKEIRPYLGIFIRASSQWASYKPATAEFFPMDRWLTSFSPGIVPRLFLKLGNRWQLDLSVPVVLGSISFDRTTMKNPALTPAQQRNSIVDMDILSTETQIRLGFAYRLNKVAAVK